MVERVVLAFSKRETAEKIKNMLYGSGYEAEMVCRTKAELMRYISDIDEVLVIMGYKLPDAVADAVYEDMREGQKLMSIVKADKQIDNPDILTVPLPVSLQRLISSIEIFLGVIEKRSKNTGRAPEEDKIVNKAKLYLMETYMMTEQQAHRFIQKRSMDTGARFADTARSILNI